METGAIIAGGALLLTLGGALIGIGAWLGTIRSNFMSKDDCFRTRETCKYGNAGKIEEAKKEIEKVENKMEEDHKEHKNKTDQKINKLEERHVHTTDVIFKKINQIFDKMEDIGKELIKIQTQIMIDKKDSAK